MKATENTHPDNSVSWEFIKRELLFGFCRKRATSDMPPKAVEIKWLQTFVNA